MSLCTLLSRLLGMVRDVVMAAAFGAGPVMDAFSVAFRIPNLARRLFGEGALTSAFLPEFVRVQTQEGEAAARELAAAMFLSLVRILVGLTLGCEAILLAVRWLLPLSHDTALLIDLLMLLTPYVIGICLAAQQSAVLHALRSFLWPSLLPIVLNLIWLAAIPLVFAIAQDEAVRMRWLCVAIVLGGAVQLGIPRAVLKHRGYSLLPSDRSQRDRVRAVYAAMLPILFGVSVTQFNSVIDSMLAWGLCPGDDGTAAADVWSWLPVLPNGTASALYFGQRMYQFPLGVIGVAIGTVLFPELARHAGRGDRDRLREDLTTGLGLAVSIGLPAGLGLMVLSRPITSLLFEHGRFTAEDGALTASMIVAYGAAVWAFIALLVAQRGYYAVGDRATPVRHALIAVAVNLLLDAVLLFPLGGTGLAWATCAATCVQAGLAIHGIQTHVGPLPWRRLGILVFQSVATSSAMTLVCLATQPRSSSPAFSNRLWEVVLPLSAGTAAYFAAAWLFRLREPWRLIRHGSLIRQETERRPEDSSSAGPP